MARYEIFVTYKKGIFDPPGATAERALANLGYEGVDEVKIGKYIRIAGDADLADGHRDVREAARQPGHRGLPHRDGGGARPCASASSSSPAPTASRTSSTPRSYLGFEAEYVWHGDTDLSGFDAVVLPGGFCYGDYIRTGAVARFSPVMAEVVRFAEKGGPVLGICNGFQILTEAHLLPGALLRNRGLKFICKPVTLRVEDSACQWLDLPPGSRRSACRSTTTRATTSATPRRSSARTPTARSCCATASPTARPLAGGSAPNGALDDIAGICNERGNVFGLMPHPERVVDPIARRHRRPAVLHDASSKRLAEVAG